METLQQCVERMLHEPRRIRVVKGGPGSGYFNHPGRPGKVGGSLPKGFGGEAYYHFAQRAEMGRYKDKGKLGDQGAQATTYLIELEGGMPAVKKNYKSINKTMSTSDAASYEISQALGMDEVLMAVDMGGGESIQRFVNNSDLWFDYPYKTYLEEEQFDEAMLFDVLIGNTDRHGGNIMIHKKTGRITLIDNGFSLADSIMLRNNYADAEGWVKSIVRDYNNLVPGNPIASLTESEWTSFVEKAQSEEMYNIVMDNYGGVIGQKVHNSMMLRLKIFDDIYYGDMVD